MRGRNSRPVRIHRRAGELFEEWSLTDGWTGYNGTAEPVAPLNEDGEEGDTAHQPILDQEKTLPELGDPSAEGLSLITKFFVLALIVGVCYAYVRAHSPRRTGPAGRHGAYEKGGLP